MITIPNTAKFLAVVLFAAMAYFLSTLRVGEVGSERTTQRIAPRLDRASSASEDARGERNKTLLSAGFYPDDPAATAELQHIFPIYPADVDVEIVQDDDGYAAADLFADRGTTLVAVTSGVIDAVGHQDNWSAEVDDPLSRSGKFVSLVADDGFRYFVGHLEQVEEDLQPGMRIRVGQQLGTVGNSGDALDQQPHVHFAISGLENWGVRPVMHWPYRVLRLWEAGHLTALPDFVTHAYPIGGGAGTIQQDGDGPAVNIFAAEGASYLAPVDGVVEAVNGTDDWELVTTTTSTTTTTTSTTTTTTTAPEVTSTTSDPAFDPESLGTSGSFQNDGDGGVEVGNPEGLYVTLRGADGYRYYASHLGSIASGIRTGAKVEAGHRLGIVGRSGNVREDDRSRLYFAIGDADSGTIPPGAHSPGPVLEAWRNGRIDATVATVEAEAALADQEQESSADTEEGVAMVKEHTYPVIPRSDSQYAPGGHNYPATDIFALTGTEVVAPTSGVIERISHRDFFEPETPITGTRGGVFVAIVGDDGFRYYISHLDTATPELSAGARVVVGEKLGTVGQSGNAVGKEPHIHFDISPADDWDERLGRRDPVPVLEAWKSGDREANPNTAG